MFIFKYTLSYSCFDDSFCLSIRKVKVYSDMTDNKDEGIRYCTFCLSYFHSSLQDQHPKYQENHRKKVSLHVLQEIDYKKANATNNGLFYSQLKMLVMQQSRLFVIYFAPMFFIIFVAQSLTAPISYSFSGRIVYRLLSLHP